MVLYNPTNMADAQVYTTGRSPEFLCTAALDAKAPWGLDEKFAREISRRKRLARQRVKSFEKEFSIAHDNRAAVQAVLESRGQGSTVAPDCDSSQPRAAGLHECEGEPRIVRPTDYDRIPEPTPTRPTASKEEADALVRSFLKANAADVGDKEEVVG